MTRKTYHWDPEQNALVEGPGPRRVDGSGDGWRFSDRIYSGTPFKAPDGTVIDSKAKHREYMKRTGLTTTDDSSRRGRRRPRSVLRSTRAKATTARRDAKPSSVPSTRSRGG